MKYSELKQIVEKYDGYDFDLDANVVCIASYGGNAVVFHYDGEVEIDIEDVPDDPFPTEILRAVAEVMDTPLEERTDSKRYFIHLLPGVSGYLQYDQEHDGERGDEVFYTGSLNYLDEGQHDFTPSEINAFADKYPDSAIPHFDKDNPIFEEVSEDGND